jgi:uncharacterized protein with ATP-grasp and redox domains
MITAHACIPCLTRQIVDSVARVVPAGDARADGLLRICLQALAEADFHRPPPVIAQAIQCRLRRCCGVDPFLEVKREACALALSLLPELQGQVAAASDPLALALRFAAAGNLIDVGLVQDIGRGAIERALQESRSCELDQATIERLRRRIAGARRILYLADNAGELVFDRLLLDLLPHERVTLAVRGGPILNDVTREDVPMSGIADNIAIIDNGSDAPGTVLEECSAAFRQAFAAADLVISKGQGNFETLEGERGPILFILKAKCQLVADLLQVPLGSIVARFAD